ncbi:YxeA family protein [Staphylococcus aureus]|uniref:YxeA family protein n=1 Tax=Staphylococcus aureus TaxID=1280 RepID=UPI000452E0BE|nr:YxeA family protein [Staphylococcus aureus]EGQ0540353.1 YxeA family protein [Staphylococcus aureus]EZY61449.1 hypothetical protein V060_02292 [Staphylococcus aureus R0294]EZY62928.1 hypothetical protein V061_01658 [Staphylococcus aureus R0353]EZY64213.1 hypothetical protein V062_02520 [Staphylococcus aureus R0357]EZY67734.1 hypothetical protein V063_02703 [Staphylococcus aureus R0487]
MKTKIIMIVSFLVFTFILLLGMTIVAATITKNSANEGAGLIDRYNPIVQWDESYIRTGDPAKKGPHGTATYRETVINDEGKTRPLEFLALKVLAKDRYLKIKHKGAHVESYEEVKKDKLPKEVREKLK